MLFKKLFFTLLPKNLISRLWGSIASSHLPTGLVAMIVKLLCRIYHISLDDYLVPAGGFATINEFFSRALKPGARPIDSGADVLVSPADGTVLEAGTIRRDMLLQVKGRPYSLKALLGEEALASRFMDGHYLTIYLSPHDYHRVHVPLTARLLGFHYIPGTLFPVNAFGVKEIANLFAVNERVISLFEQSEKMTALIMVGATMVGSIRLKYDSLRTNQGAGRPFQHILARPIPFEKGQEMAQFEFGSTVILLFEKDQVKLESFPSGTTLRLGQKIATRI
jgi:phosphatidylserine decarboxylase